MSFAWEYPNLGQLLPRPQCGPSTCPRVKRMPPARRKVESGSALRRQATGSHTKLNQDRRGPSAAHALLVGAATLSMAALSLLAQSPPPQPPSPEPAAQMTPAQGQPAGGRGG